MTEGQIRGKWFWVQANGEFKITEFKLAGSRYILFYLFILFILPHNSKVMKKINNTSQYTR